MKTKVSDKEEDAAGTPACANCGSPFPITRQDLIFYSRLEVPPPTHCPDCRQQRRLAFNNELNLHRRSCDFSKQPILSNFPPGSPFKVYKQEIWWSDRWEPLHWGREIDFTRPFFEQFAALIREVPLPALNTNYLLDENSDYTNYAGSNKDCYLIAHADYNQDCYYGYGVKRNRNAVDVYNIFNSELCYECIDCRNAYNLRYAQNCTDCTDSAFLKDCVACKDCIGCKNLYRRQYCIFNEQVSKEDYQAFLAKHPLHSRRIVSELERQFQQLTASLPNRYLQILHCENSFGDHLHNCRNTDGSFDGNAIEDGKFCYQVFLGAKDCFDIYQFGNNIELCYECSATGYNVYLARFCHSCNEQTQDVSYSQFCFHSKHLFGCIGLRQKEHCILNKQYSAADYTSQSRRLIAHMRETGEWGEFFPISLSPFGYNDTMAQFYYPLTEAEAKAKGYGWQEPAEKNNPSASPAAVPDGIHEVQGDLQGLTFQCRVSGKPYSIIPQELAFYRKMGIPLPDLCFQQRHSDRLSKRNPRKLWNRCCEKCGERIQSSYSPERYEIVYCESCYQDELYG